MLSWLCGSDEELLGRGLELNDSIQTLLAKHDAIASGSPLPSQYASPSSSFSPTEESRSIPGDSEPTFKANSPIPVPSAPKGQIDEEEEEEDEFAELARRLLLPNKILMKFMFLDMILIKNLLLIQVNYLLRLGNLLLTLKLTKGKEHIRCQIMHGQVKIYSWGKVRIA